MWVVQENIQYFAGNDHFNHLTWLLEV